MTSDSSNLLHRIVEALPEVLWLRDAVTGRFLHCSAGAEALWKCSPDQLSRNPDAWKNAILLNDRPTVLAAWKHAAKAGVFDQQYRVRLASGEIKWIHDRGFQVSSDGKDSPQLAGLARDITERKRLEAEVRKTHDALHSSANGVIITDRDGRITYANPAFLSLFRWIDPSAAIGTQAEELFVREDIEELSDVADEIASSGLKTREFTVKRQDGSEVFVEVSSSEVHDERGEVIGSMASFVDVTERKLREIEARKHHHDLLRLTERMVVLEEQERRRISALLHDTAVQSFSLSNIRLGGVSKALGEQGLDQERKQLESAREMIAEGIRQCRLVMADLTPPLLYEVGLAAAFRQYAERMQRLQGIQIEVEETAPGIGVPESVRGLLFQSMRELVMNACKHAAPSRIRIQLHCSKREVRLSVRDDGAGFDPRVLEQRRRDDSWGFGLFSIRQRLARFSGVLRISSKPGNGSELQVILPLGKGEEWSVGVLE